MTIYQRCIAKWGLRAQFDIAVEEMSECILAIQHWKRGRPSNLPEEVADLEITAAQLRSIVGDDEVDRIKAEKMERLERRLASGDFNG